MWDMIVIGAGPAGLTAALYAHRAGLHVLILEGALPGGQTVNTPHVENWPGTVHITGPDFAYGLYEQAQQLGIKLRTQAVTGLRIDEARKLVLCGDAVHEARTVIVASGLQRRQLQVAGEDRLAGKGVSYCAICDGNFFRGREVAVVGGGDTALEDALYLSKICPTVYLLHRGDTFRAKQYLIDAVQQAENIRPMLQSRVTAIEGDSAVERVLVQSADGTHTLTLGGLFVAIGFQPDNERFSPPLSLDAQGFFLAGDDCTTSLSGVFAAGDCRAKEFRQLITAAADGAIAASRAGQYLLSGEHEKQPHT